MRCWIIILGLLVSASGQTFTGEDLRELCIELDSITCAAFIRRVVSKMSLPKHVGSSALSRQMKEIKWVQCPNMYSDEKLIRIFLAYATQHDLQYNAEFSVTQSLLRFAPECLNAKAL